MMSKKLTDKQQTFIDEYLIDLNATQAAIRAGYSENRADATAYNLLRNTELQKAIQEAQKERREANNVTREGIISEIDSMIAIAKNNATEGNTAALSPWLRALETKAKLYGLFDAEIMAELNSPVDDEIIVTVIDARKQQKGGTAETKQY